jgi:DNA-binding transcriptional regulator YdaS (Cro superfamily)
LAEQRADFKVPAERVLLIEAATGGRVSRHELRPDLYPLEKIA